MFGQGAVYLLWTTKAPTVCEKGRPLTFEDVSVYRVAGASARFDLTTWVGRGAAAYSLSALAGALSSTQSGGAVY